MSKATDKELKRLDRMIEQALGGLDAATRKKVLNEAMGDFERKLEKAKKASGNACVRKALIRLAHQRPELRDDLLPLVTREAAGWKEVSIGGTKYRWRKNDLFKKNDKTQAALDIEFDAPRAGWRKVKNLSSRDKVFEKALGRKPGAFGGR